MDNSRLFFFLAILVQEFTSCSDNIFENYSLLINFENLRVFKLSLLTLQAALVSVTFILIIGICRGSIWEAFDKVISGLLSIYSDEVIGYYHLVYSQRF